jgi:MSHA biogenesis protein MshN
MSLLNDVLKDLDARQAVASGSRPLPSAVRPLPAPHKPRRPWGLAALIGGVLVAGLGGYAYFVLRPSALEAPSVPAAVVTVPAAPPSAVPAARPVPPVPPVHSGEPAALETAAADAVPTGVEAVVPTVAASVVDASGADDEARRAGDTRTDAPQGGVKPASAPAKPPGQTERSVRSAQTPAPAPAPGSRVPRGDAVAPAATGAEPPPARNAERIVQADKVEKTDRAADKARAASSEEKPAKAAIERSDAGAAGERVDGEYRKAVNALNQGRVVEAIEGLRGVLRGDPLQRAARQLLVKLLIEAGRSDEAIDVLRDGLRGQPAQIGWAMALARLQVDRGDLSAAWTTLDASLPAAGNSADYQGFAGNVLQRLGRSREAIARFQAATRLAPGDGRWWLGLGLAHDAEGEVDPARTAFLNARQSANLTPELQALVERKLRQ